MRGEGESCDKQARQGRMPSDVSAHTNLIDSQEKERGADGWICVSKGDWVSPVGP